MIDLLNTRSCKEGTFCGLRPINVSALSDARFREGAKLGEVLCARSIESLEGGRCGCGGCGLMAGAHLAAMGIESFFVCSLLILHGLGKSQESENRC
jgi:hypothetical protein